MLELEPSRTASPSLPSVAEAAGAHGWLKNMRDLRVEHGFRPLEIRGRLPEGLAGTLYRNGPALFSSFGRRYQHWFDGDGAVSAVRFCGGRAEAAVRLVEGPGLLEERRAGRNLYGSYGTRERSALHRLRRQRKNVANTSVMVWQGRLYAMVESSRPIELQPNELATLGERDLDGAVLETFSAHPHPLPARQAAYNFGVRYGQETELDLFELPSSGPARRLATLPLCGATLIHDFIATPRYLVFFAPPLRLRIGRFLLGLGSYSENLAWRPELGTEVMVVPIDAPEEVRRFPVGAFFQWHFANAFEDGDQLVVDLVRYSDFGSNAWLRDVLHGPPGVTLDGRFERLRLTPASGRVEHERVSDRLCEFPSVALPAVGRPYRWAYAATHGSPEATRGMFDRVGKLDVERGTLEEASFGAGRYPSEPVFVPRPASAAEDDGWLLSLVYDAASDRSFVAVLDARAPSAGPIAETWLDHALPFTFHGVFAPARE